MINLEHKLTVDDLIVEYIVYKTKNGYEPSFSGTEFMDFLMFFEKQMKVEDTLYNKKVLLTRFWLRKNNNDWYNDPHMNLKYISEIDDYVLSANYKLSGYDMSVITTYFMEERQKIQIRKIIGQYLENKPKRKVNENIIINENELLLGKYVSSNIIMEILDSYIKKQIEKGKWPKNCIDINKYLFQDNFDVNNQLIKKVLIELYDSFSKKIGTMYNEDKKLKFSSSTNFYLSEANYNLIIKNFEMIMNIIFNEYKFLSVDFSKNEFMEGHELGGVYDFDDVCDYRLSTMPIINDKAKSLIKSIDGSR